MINGSMYFLDNFKKSRALISIKLFAETKSTYQLKNCRNAFLYTNIMSSISLHGSDLFC
jgi:hypothetical protein